MLELPSQSAELSPAEHFAALHNNVTSVAPLCSLETTELLAVPVPLKRLSTPLPFDHDPDRRPVACLKLNTIESEKYEPGGVRYETRIDQLWLRQDGTLTPIIGFRNSVEGQPDTSRNYGELIIIPDQEDTIIDEILGRMQQAYDEIIKPAPRRVGFWVGTLAALKNIRLFGRRAS